MKYLKSANFIKKRGLFSLYFWKFKGMILPLAQHLIWQDGIKCWEHTEEEEKRSWNRRPESLVGPCLLWLQLLRTAPCLQWPQELPIGLIHLLKVTCYLLSLSHIDSGICRIKPSDGCLEDKPHWNHSMNPQLVHTAHLNHLVWWLQCLGPITG